MVGIITQSKKFYVESRRQKVDQVAMRSCKYFERQLRIKLKVWSQFRNAIEQVSVAKIDHKICIRACSWNAIDIARHCPYKHILDPEFLKTRNYLGHRLFAIHICSIESTVR